MKLLLLITWLSWGAAEQPDSIGKNAVVNPHRTHRSKHHRSSTAQHLKPSGTATFTPKGSKNKTGIPDSKYHNEQDNFKAKPNPNNATPTPDTKPKDRSDVIPYEDKPQVNQTTASPAVNIHFEGESCPNNIPPDNTMAIAANGNIVSAVNCGIFFYDNAGNSTGSNTYPTFFNTTTSEFSDPRVIYDPYSDRFIFFIQFGHTPSTSVLYVAFSSSNDPTQAWKIYSYNVSSISTGTWFDYPSVGINETDFCVSGNLFDAGNNGVGNVVMLFKKSDGYSGNASLTNTYWANVKTGSSNNGFTITPATAGQSSTYNGKMYLVSTYSGGGSQVTLYTINGTAGNSPTIGSTDITTNQSYSPSATATQPNGINLANYKAGCRVQSACYVNGIIHFVFAANYSGGGGSANSVYLNRIDVSNNTINQNWSYLSSSNYNYPAVASYGTGTSDQAVLIGFLKSDASTNAEIRFKYFDNNMNQLNSIQVRQGDGPINYSWASEQRWGDYTGIQRRYGASQPEVWIGGSYGTSGNIYRTYIAQVTGYPGLVSISEVTMNKGMVTAYPNPVKDQLYIKGDFRDFNGFPTMYDIQGREVSIDVTRRDNSEFQIDVSTLSSGNYLLKVGEGRSLKFIKE